jgi:TRAP-type C4-dicarboxylate transport system permease small subunit
MNKLWAGVAAIARIAVWCGGAMVFGAAVLVTAEVLLRKGLGAIFGTSVMFSGSDEISAYLFAGGTSWSMAHVLVTRGHVRIDALYGRLPAQVRSLLDLFALLTMALFVAVLLERAWDLAFASYSEGLRSNTPLRLPLAWAQLPWLAGIALFFIALILAVVRTVAALARGDQSAVAQIAGAATQDEEIASELSGLGLRSEKAVGER